MLASRMPSPDCLCAAPAPRHHPSRACPCLSTRQRHARHARGRPWNTNPGPLGRYGRYMLPFCTVPRLPPCAHPTHHAPPRSLPHRGAPTHANPGHAVCPHQRQTRGKQNQSSTPTKSPPMTPSHTYNKWVRGERARHCAENTTRVEAPASTLTLACSNAKTRSWPPSNNPPLTPTKR